MAAGVDKVGDQPVGDRVPGPDHDHRQARVLLGSEGSRIAQGHDHRDLARHQLVDELRQAVEVAVRRTPLKSEVLPKDQPVACEAADQPGGERTLIYCFASGRQQPDAIYLRCRLRRRLRRSVSEDQDQYGNECERFH